jgi:hypothetical protein
MIKTKALSSAAVLGMVAMLFVGCGDGDNTKTQVCRASEAKCLSDGDGQVCSADGSEFLKFSCEDDEVCREGACVASCEVGAVTCAGKAVSRICTDEGNQWEPVPCPAGTACVEGDGCVPSDEGVTICQANESVCANATTVKTCDADGAGWVYTSCGPNETCDDGECVFDEDRTCTPRDRACIDDKTAAICKDNGKGWKVTECPDGISCSDGACRGPVCVVGDTKCDEPDFVSIVSSVASLKGAANFRLLYTCVDGKHWEATQCDTGTICTYDDIPVSEVERFSNELAEWYLLAYGAETATNFPKPPDTSNSVASCKAPECDAPAQNFFLLTQAFRYFPFYGDPFLLEVAQCGNALDSKADPTSAYSVCRGLPPYSNLEWSVTECPEPTTCSTEIAYGFFGLEIVPTCSSECVPGEVRCSWGSQGGSGSIDSTQTCGPDGKWGPPEACPAIKYDGKEAYSAVCVPGHTGSSTVGTQSARCIDPTCAYWEQLPSIYGLPSNEVGACTEDGRFRRCNDKGLLEAPKACDEGFCFDYGAPNSPAAGQNAGFCQAECTDGEAYCFTGNTLRRCVNGEWSLDLDVCDAGVSCYDWYDNDKGYYGAICGECVPGHSYCDGDSIVTCDDGVYVESKCKYGTCVSAGDFVQCEAPCLEGQKVCNSDGSTSYTECVNGQTVNKNCGAGTSCRIDDHGVHYACVECLGPKTSGNDFGLTDAYCNAAGNVVSCGNNNKYGSAKTCNGTCYGYFDASNTAPLSATWAYCGPQAPDE